MMNKKILKKIELLFIWVAALVFLASSNNTVFAISQNDYENLHTPFYDDCAPPESQSSSAAGNVEIKQVYMVGDSITLGAKDDYDLEKKFRDAGIDADITASGGAGLNHAGSTGSKKSGLQSVKDDGNIIKSADAVVVAHTTNDVHPVFKGLLRDMIREIKKHSESVKIFWVNADTSKTDGNSDEQQAWSADAAEKKNEIIQQESSSLGFTPIDIKAANLPLASDKIHPAFSSAGHGKWGDTVVGGVTGGGTVSTPENTDPLGELCCPGGGDGGGETTLSGSENAEKIFNFLVDKDLTPVQAAGVVGNFSVETGGTFSPFIQETSQTPPLGGYGIAQWTGTGAPGDPAGARRLDMIKAMKDAGLSVDLTKQTINESEDEEAALAAQLDYMWKEATERGDIQKLKLERTIKGAVESWLENFERAGIPHTVDREAAGQTALDKYGGGGGGALSSGPSGGGNCACEPSSSNNGSVVVLDPGHSGIDKQGQEKDSETGIYIGDSSNPGERQQMWRVSQKIKAKLEPAGFEVIVTKNKENSYVNLKKRAAIANNANAAIAVSLHNTPGSFGSESVGWVTPQKVGGYRIGNSKVEFKNQELADKSLEYSEAILAERKKTEGGVQLHDISFDGRAGLSPGNLPAVQLFSKVPWVYNEVGQSGFNENKYSEGIAEGIIKALGDSAGGGGGGDCSDAVSGDIQSTVKSYAYPDYHSAPFNKPRGTYAAAIDKALANGQYVGGTVGGHPGIDCGGFVTRVMIDSGFEPRYNYSGKVADGAGPTTTQEAWLQDNWQKINPSSTRDLQPGDVGINSNHTFLYVGKIQGFNDVFASASFSTSGNGRAPMAGQGDAMGGAYNWYRKK